jgi:hypothetical protein
MGAERTSRLQADPGDETARVLLEDRVTSRGGSAPAPEKLSRPIGRSFRWSAEAVHHLYEEVQWALTCNPTGAAEITGVLLGKSDSSIEVVDCQPVFLMQEQDHAYALGGPGKREFERAIADFRSIPERELSVVGFYRSEMGDRLDLTEEDLGLIRTCFRNANAMVLLIKLSEDGSSNVRLFSGDEGRLLSEFRCTEKASGLPRWLELWENLSAADRAPEVPGPEDTRRTVEATDLVPASGPVVTARPERSLIRPDGEVQENSTVVERRWRRRPAFLVALAIILLVLMGFLIFDGPASLKHWTGSYEATAAQMQAGSPRYPALALRVQRQGDDLRLDWDRTAPVLRAATGGMLTIREGNGAEKQVLLDINLLRTGAVIYQPVHGDIILRLVIFGPNGSSIGESLARYSQRISASRSHP